MFVKRVILFFSIFLISLVFNKLNAQQIVATKTAGCAPLSGVAFTGLSGASAIQWLFGDATSSNLNNPTHSYGSPGNYIVTYTAIVASAPVTQTLNIKVFGKPTPNFSVTPVKGCIPLSTNFTDLSVGSGTSAITQWQWSFGDGGVSTVQNPNYIYTIPGTFNVTLLVKDANGCDSVKTVNALINVSPKPTVVITPSVVAACVAPYTATFSGTGSVSNSTTGSTTLAISWNINGTTSTVLNPPPYTFTTTGSFPVTLTCTDNNNCSNTQTVTVNISSPVVKALVKSVACFNKTFTVRDSSAAGSVQWTFGDATAPVFIFPPSIFTHTYTSPGTYTITALAAIGTCTTIKTYTITVEKPVANFTAAPPFSCNSPMLVNYTNTSTGSATYSWSFAINNGTSVLGTSTAANPTYTWTQGSLNPFTIYPKQLLTATLVAISPGGCRDTIVKNLDTLRKPTAFFYTNVVQGCVPLVVNFTDSSRSQQPITNHSWNFGDGSPLNIGTTNTFVVHTYTTPGVYLASLTVTNSAGCTDVSFNWTITVSTPPIPAFSFSPTTACHNQTIQVTNSTPALPAVQDYHVNSDLTYFSSCITDPNPGWVFTHTGTFSLSMSATSFGCTGTTTSTVPLVIKGPIVTGRVFTRCDSIHKVRFDIRFQDATSAVINFGDGNTTTVTASGSVTHTYAATGSYTALVIGSNTITGCVNYIDTLKFQVRSIKSSFTSNTLTCKGAVNTFSSTSQDVFAGCGVGYTWFFGSFPPVITANPTTTFSFPAGTYPVKLVVKDINGCRDTSTSNMVVSYVTPSIAVSSTVGCMPSFNLTGNSLSTSDAPITSYAWNFGDGGTATGTTVVHTYTNAVSPFSTYTIVFVATNSNGCTGTYTLPIVMNAPLPSIFPTSTNSICAGQSVNFQSFFTGATTYTYNFGDGSPLSVTGSSTAVHTYTTGGTYNANVAVTDINGCKGTAIPTVVQVQNYPTAAISFTNTSNPGHQNACAGALVTFSDTSINPYPGPRVWDLGTGGPIAGGPSTGTIYPAAGTYTIKLTTTTTFGCSNTKTMTVNVYSATANFTLSTSNICKGDGITFTIKDSSKVLTWGWDFGDGVIYDSTKKSPITHIYNYHPTGGTTNVTMLYYSTDSACRYAVIKPINIWQVIANFNRNNEVAKKDTVHCVGTLDNFNNLSVSYNNFIWNFGDGGTSTVVNPSHTYASPGVYSVYIAISDNVHGCKDTMRKKMYIYPVPTVSVTARDTCSGKPTYINASGGTTYTWTPPANLSCTVCANPVATLTANTVYTVNAVDANGCGGSSVITINSQQPPKPISWDTTIVIGQTPTLPGNVGSNYTYSWTPITDLSCFVCDYPVTSTTVNITYSVTVKDNLGCFTRVNTYTVYVEPKSSIDVPTAFTPNGDGINDLINVDGWGIKKLNYFRVYNRWGELLYETSNLKTGWDGFYKGAPQNMETYVYQAEVETYIDVKPLIKTGYFKLIR